MFEVLTSRHVNLEMDIKVDIESLFKYKDALADMLNFENLFCHLSC